MRAIAIIPVRFDSERLPGKPILEEAREVTGKYIVQHVYERVAMAESVSEVIVATDDVRIVRAVEQFGGRVRMTSPDHRSGTDRIAEVAAERECSIVVNVQGDEPEITPEQVDAVTQLLRDDPHASMGTLAHRITDTATFNDPAAVKVVVDADGCALYFSRSPIPYVRGDAEEWLRRSGGGALKHLGVYSFRRDFLLRYAALPPSELEGAEKLEQLRALEAGFRIRVALTDTPCLGIDTPADLRRWLDKFRTPAPG